MASINPTGTLAWLRSRSQMEPYLSNPGGYSLFTQPPFKPVERYAFRDVEILPRVGTRIDSEHLAGQQSISFPIPRHGDLLGALTLRMTVKIQGTETLATAVTVPPTMTADSTTVTTGAVVGTYVAAASIADTGFSAYKAFDGSASTSWRTPAATFENDGSYTGATETVASGITLAGPYLELTLPQSLTVSSYGLQAANVTGTAPKTWALCGYDADASAWRLIETRAATVPSAAQVRFSVSAPAYSKFRLIVTSTDSSDIATLAVFSLSGEADITAAVTPTAMLEKRIQPFHPLMALLKLYQADLFIGNKSVQSVYGEASAFHEAFRRGLPMELYPNSAGEYHLHVELPFFNRSSDHALPLIKLTEHDAELRLRLAPLFERNPISTVREVDWPEPTISNITLLGRYFFVSDVERAAMVAPSSYQRIIEDWVVHRVPIEGPARTQRVDVPFRGPVSSLMFRFAKSHPSIKSIAFAVNNNTIVGPHPPEFFRDFSQVSHHTNSLALGAETNAFLVHFDTFGDAQVPDGHLDFGSFDRCELILEFDQEVADETYLHIYGRSWNVFHIRDGMASKVFAF